MKTKLLFILIAFTTLCNAQIVNIPDANFKNYLTTSICSSTEQNLINSNFDYLNYSGANNYSDVDLNNDGEIQVNEALSVTELRLSTNLNCNPCDLLNSFEGIEAFSNLKILMIYSTGGVQSLNIDSILPNLEFVKIFNINSYQTSNQLPLRDLSFKNLPLLKYIDFDGVYWLENIEISNNPNLLKINYDPTYYDSSQSLSSLVINNLPLLDFLYLKINLNSNLDLSSLNSQNIELFISSNNLSSILYPTVARKIEASLNPSLLNFKNMSSLKELITGIDNSNSTVNTINYGNIASTLEKLTLSTSNIESNTNLFSFIGLTNLKELNLNGGAINSNIIFNDLISLQTLNLNTLNFLNASSLNFLPLVKLDNLKIIGNNGTPITLNLNGLLNLNKLEIDCGTKIETVNLSTLSSINDLNIKGNGNNLGNITNIDFGVLSSANKINIFGNNHPITINNNLLVTESFKVLYNWFNIFNQIPPSVLFFTGSITTPLLELKGIHPVFMNTSNSIDYLKINNSYAVGNNTLNNLNLSNVQVDKFAITYSSSDYEYGATNKEIILSEFTDIKEFSLTSYLNHTYASYNHVLNEIDLNAQKNLEMLNISMPKGNLNKLFLKNGKNNYKNLEIYTNDNLKYICVDDNNEAQQIQTNIRPSLVLNSNDYCTFVPGSVYYSLIGNQRVDFNNNGCDNNDESYPSLKVRVNNGLNENNYISDIQGNFDISLVEGTYTISPQLENPTYFNISPSNLQASFPATTSPLTQNFCITPNGVHHDVEVTLIPITPARPGFNATYKIIYKNKGTQVENGTVTLTYLNQDALDIVSCNPAFNLGNSDGYEKTLTWNYVALKPFETREITVVLNLNDPTETPPLNIGEILSMTSKVTPDINDETPIDNRFDIRQVIVGSYDPNDKTCIEGTTITPAMVGEYVHYVIRFENTGTYPAENVVVKDIIDASKFDINTLIPIKGSHDFETRISNTNKVEFIFENINLPFDDATNDGYVAFKIKTKPNLVVGNTFSNQANIYFDYNFPIVTNNYTTTVHNTLGLQENELIKDIVSYPNPVKDFLNFKTERNVLKVEVYDISGRILSSNSVYENKIDLSNLRSGNYMLKVYTEKGIINTKIIKE